MVQWTLPGEMLPGEHAGGESRTPLWPDSCAWVGRVLCVGLMGKRTEQDRTAAWRGARNGPEGPEGPLLRPREKDLCPVFPDGQCPGGRGRPSQLARNGGDSPGPQGRLTYNPSLEIYAAE